MGRRQPGRGVRQHYGRVPYFLYAGIANDAVLVGQFLTPDASHIMTGVLLGDGDLTVSRAATVDVPDGDGTDQTFGTAEPAWGGGRVTGAVGSRVVYDTDAEGVEYADPPWLAVTAGDSHTLDSANLNDYQGALYVEVYMAGDDNLVNGFLSRSSGNLTLDDGTTQVATAMSAGEWHEVGIAWSVPDNQMDLFLEGSWIGAVEYDWTMLSGDLDLFRDAANGGKMRNLRIYSDGGVNPVSIDFYASSTGVLPGFVFDNARNFYYWGGQERALSDMTAVPSFNYEISDLSWLDKSEFAVLVERDLDESVYSAQPTGTQALMSIGSTTTARAFYVYHQNAYGFPRGYGYSTTLTDISVSGDFIAFGNALGRRRVMVRAKTGEVYKSAHDGMVKDGYAGANTWDTHTQLNRVSIGHRRLVNADAKLNDAMLEKLRVVIYPYLSDSDFEATAKQSFEDKPPIHLLGDSIFNAVQYFSGGGVLEKLSDSLPVQVYRAWSTSVAGGTSLSDFATRYAANSEHWGDNLLIGEGGLDYAAGGAALVASIQSMVANCTSGRWAIIEPVISSNLTTGSAERIAHDAAWAAIVAYATTARVIPTQAAMLAANDGSAGDLEDVANDVCPRSLRTDGIHLNETGWGVYAAAIKSGLKTLGWV